MAANRVFVFLVFVSFLFSLEVRAENQDVFSGIIRPPEGSVSRGSQPAEGAVTVQCTAVVGAFEGKDVAVSVRYQTVPEDASMAFDVILAQVPLMTESSKPPIKASLNPGAFVVFHSERPGKIVRMVALNTITRFGYSIYRNGRKIVALNIIDMESGRELKPCQRFDIPAPGNVISQAEFDRLPKESRFFKLSMKQRPI